MEPQTEKPAVVALPQLWEKQAIKDSQDSIKKSLTALDGDIHANFIQCMLHAEKHGDTSLMRRLLVETLGDKNGYRTRGLINHMHQYSPIRLKGKDNLDLSGTLSDGSKSPWQIEKANATPFWMDSRNDEKVAKPVYQEAIVGKINAAIREGKAALANTVDGKPVNPKEPFYPGVHPGEVINLLDELEKIKAKFPKDSTKAAHDAKVKLAAVQAEVESYEAPPAVVEAQEQAA